jgi:hypothetical protein
MGGWLNLLLTTVVPVLVLEGRKVRQRVVYTSLALLADISWQRIGEEGCFSSVRLRGVVW